MMARQGSAWAAKINGNAYRDHLTKHPDAQKITLTRPQMEAIIRDLCEYSDLHAEATEQATRSAARIAELEQELLVARGIAIVRKVIADLDARDARSEAAYGADGAKRAPGCVRTRYGGSQGE